MTSSQTSETKPLFTAFSEHGWDAEEEIYAPSISEFANSFTLWLLCQQREGVTIEEAALVWNLCPNLIFDAIEYDMNLFIGLGGAIEVDGE